MEMNNVKLLHKYDLKELADYGDLKVSMRLDVGFLHHLKNLSLFYSLLRIKLVMQRNIRMS